MASEATSPLNILIVSADSGFVTKCDEQLRRILGAEMRAVDSVERALEWLSETTVDCIVSDHDLPDTDGVAFLEAIRAQSPTLPFILFTADGSESVASRAISASVTEYLIKAKHSDQYDRLGRLIEDAVQYRHAHDAFIERGSRARKLLDAAHDSIVVVRDGKFEYLNRAGLELFHVGRRSEMTGRPLGDIVQSAEGRPLGDLLAEVQAGERKLDRRAVTLTDSSGVTLSVEMTAVSIDWDGEPAVVLICRDISERKSHEHELRQFRRAVEAAGHAIYITETDGTITYVNPAFEQVTGYDRESVIGRTPDIFSSGEMSPDYYKELWETITDGEIWREEISNRRQSGELYHANQTIAPISDEDGNIQEFVAIQTDITEQKEAKRNLKRYKEVVQRLEDPIMLQNRDGEFELLNDAVASYTDYSREELLGNDESSFMDEETARVIDQYKKMVTSNKEPLEYEVTPTFDTRSTEEIFSTKRYPYYDGSGELAGTIAICRNVTKQKQREEELRQYQRAITGATDLIAATDLEGRFLFANPQYCRYHEIPKHEISSLSLPEVLGTDYFANIEARFERALDGQTVRYRTTRPHPTMGDRTLDVRYYPLYNGGDVTGVVAVMRDVTDSTNRARQLRVVDRVLRHNLRNDLTAIRLRTEQLGRSPKRATDERATEEITTEILDKIDGLLTTSEKSRKITDILAEKPELRRVDLGTLLQRLGKAMQRKHPHAQINVSSDLDLVASATQNLNEAVEELIRNAIVHHDGDSPAIQIDATQGAEYIQLTITDNGPGIPKMDRDVLRSGEESNDLYHGSGLGLWLVYWIVQRSGGEIEVSDATPNGTTVELLLPRYHSG